MAGANFRLQDPGLVNNTARPIRVNWSVDRSATSVDASMPSGGVLQPGGNFWMDFRLPNDRDWLTGSWNLVDTDSLMEAGVHGTFSGHGSDKKIHLNVVAQFNFARIRTDHGSEHFQIFIEENRAGT